MKVLDKIGNEVRVGQRVALEANGNVFVGFITEIIEPSKVGGVVGVADPRKTQMAMRPGLVKVVTEFDFVFPPTPDNLAQVPGLFVLRNPPSYDANKAAAGAEVSLAKAKKEAAEESTAPDKQDDTKPN